MENSVQARSLSELHTRMWTLVLLRALNKAGLAPCSNFVFHRAAYFANVLAGIYDFQPPVEIVMRQKRGPFYPRIQRDLDWLCITGHASAKNITYEKKGEVWIRTGVYDITSKGFEVANSARSDVEWVRHAAEFLDDLALAMSFVEGDDNAAEEQDFTYNRPSSEDNPVINFRDPLDNRSLMASSQLRSLVPAGLAPIPQRTLRLYLKYLEKAAA